MKKSHKITTAGIVGALLIGGLAYGQRSLNRGQQKKDLPTVPTLSFVGVDEFAAVISIPFDEPKTNVKVTIDGGGTMTCFTESGLSFGDTAPNENTYVLGLGTGTPRMVSCEFDGGPNGGTFSNLITD
jgi:hypothetical protein